MYHDEAIRKLLAKTMILEQVSAMLFNKLNTDVGLNAPGALLADPSSTFARR